MIDIHCHILPGVDDGAQTMSDALEMAHLATQSGVRAIIATPHCNLPGADRRNFIDQDFAARFDQFHNAVVSAGIPLHVHPGAEVLCTQDTAALLESGKLMTLAGSRYLLVEFFFDERFEDMNRRLEAISALGAVPVIAHPERYDTVQQNPMAMERWFSRGYILQLNKGSILGRLGRRAYHCSRWLLSQGLAHAVASDAHSPRMRTPHMQELQITLQSLCGEEYADILLHKNPQRILHDQPVVES